MIDLFPPIVKLNESDHSYTDSAGNSYLSFSEVFEFLSPKFEANKIAYFVGGKNQAGMEQTLAKWDEQRLDGVRIDNAITHYLKYKEVPAEFDDIKQAVLELAGIYNYPKVFPQTTLYNSHYKTAGTTDVLALTTNRKDASLVLSDIKCYQEMEEGLYKHRGWLPEPFGHLPNSKYTKTVFQVSYYAYHAELLTGKRVKELFIHLIQPSTCKVGGNLNHKKIVVPFMKNDIIILLETFKDKIKEKLNSKTEFVI